MAVAGNLRLDTTRAHAFNPGRNGEAPMPTIDVSQKVLRLIRALREAGDKDESDTLDRVLTGVSEARDKALRDYEKSDQDIRSTN
jgi:hypothetical protein